METLIEKLVSFFLWMLHNPFKAFLVVFAIWVLYYAVMITAVVWFVNDLLKWLNG